MIPHYQALQSRLLIEILPPLWADVRRQLEAFAAYLNTLSHADEDPPPSV